MGAQPSAVASERSVETRGSSLLRLALKLDGAVTGANGLAYVVAAEPLGDLLGFAPSLLRAVGAFLVVFAVAVWLTAVRTAMPRPAVRAVIAANVIWALGSAAAAIAQWGSPDTPGTIWIVLQAGVVAAFADLQLIGLRRQSREHAP